MAESDFLSYSSIYETFSKGPKSIYYGVGDEMLPGAILNVPQQDEDDEWGRTQRIADERVYDFIAKIYKTLFDPYNSIPEVSLVPGEAGSEINVAKSLIKLIGRTGIDTGIFNLTNSTMSLCGVSIDGVAETINVGNVLISNNTIGFDGLFTIDQNSGEPFGSMVFGNVYTRWYDDTSTPKFIVSVEGKVFSFETLAGVPTLTIPVGGALDVPGTLKVNDINPSANLAYNIGCGGLRFNGVYSSNGYFDIVHAGEIRTNYITTKQANTPIDIGAYNLSDTVDIRAKALNIYDIDVSVPCLKIYEDSLSGYTGRIMDIGDPAGNHIINVLVKAGSVGTACGGFNVFTAGDPTKAAFGVSEFYAFLNRSLLPGETDSVTLGVSFNRFLETHTKQLYAEDIYADEITTDKGLFNTRDDLWYICGPNLNIKNSTTSTVVISVCSSQIIMREDMYVQSIYPNSAGVYLGNSDTDGCFEALHLRDVITNLSRTVQIENGVLVVY